MIPFEEAYAETDWSPYIGLPTFEPSRRINALHLPRDGARIPWEVSLRPSAPTSLYRSLPPRYTQREFLVGIGLRRVAFPA
jgi:hypothetical protein